MRRPMAWRVWLLAGVVGVAAVSWSSGAAQPAGGKAQRTTAKSDAKTATAPSPLDAAVEAARKIEKTAFDEWNSREMARAATREIARSERDRAEDALRKWRAAQDALKAASADGKAGARVPALRRECQERLTTLQGAAGRLEADTLTANKAAHELYASELTVRDKMAATRGAEALAQESRATASEQCGAADAATLRRQVHEVRAMRLMELQHWAAVRKDTASEIIEQSSEAARIAEAIAAAEVEPALRERLAAFAQKQVRETSEAQAVMAEAALGVDAITPELYIERAAAMGGLRPLSPAAWDEGKARHLLVRAGFGGTPEEVRKLHAMGLYKAVDHLVEFYRQPAGGASFDATPLLQADPLEGKLRVTFLRGRLVGVDRRGVEVNQQAQMRRWWLQRMVESPRPLQEKLALFWHGHFASQDSVVQNSYTMYRQNQFFREHAAGSFAALLYGIVHDPAMIRYLDNNKNARGKPNENLAREIMELFAMGVDQGYTEKDIIEAARALTGYNYDHATGTYRFVFSQHDTTNKAIFGRTGAWTGDDLVRLILEQPATPRFIARKLFEYFAHQEPETQTVEALASVLRERQYALEPMLKNLFLSETFYSSRSMGNQIKSPVELVVGLLRDLGARPLASDERLDAPVPLKGDGTDTARVKPLASYEAIDTAVQKMGMQLLEPPDVKGWRYGRPWISSQRLFVRYNAVAELVAVVGGRGVDVVSLLETGGCGNSLEAVDYLARACLARPLAPEKRQQLLEHLGELPPRSQWASQRAELNKKLRSALVLMLCMPEYQMS